MLRMPEVRSVAANRALALASVTCWRFDTTFEEARDQAISANPIVISPYTQNHGEHIKAIRALSRPVVRVPTPQPDQYYELLRACHATGNPVVVIEHDMVPQPWMLDELLACDRPWCGFPYRVANKQVEACLGFTKLDVGYVKTAFDEITVTHWSALDREVARVLSNHGLTMHVHNSQVTHINPFGAVEGIRDADLMMMRNYHLGKRNANWWSPDTTWGKSK